MYKLTIVGMGPGGDSFVTLEALDALTTGKKIYLRTERHPNVQNLVARGMVYESFDDVYDRTETFEETYEEIVKDIIRKLESEDVTYAVPGNPHVAELTVSKLIQFCKESGTPYAVIHGASFLDAMITALEIDPVTGLNIVDAFNLLPETLHIGEALIVLQVYDQNIASGIKLKLSALYGDDHEVAVVCGAGVPGLERIVFMPLYEIDRDASLLNHLTSLYVPAFKGDVNHIARLIQIMRRLRGEGGCPWDREQTHESLTKYLIEEAYEVKHAVEHEDDNAVVDELGDVLLQVIFHTTIAEEDGYYAFEDVVKAVCDKMIRRHPHVFADAKADTSDEVLMNWQEIKNKEKKAETRTDSMMKISFSLPALMRSQKIQKIAANVGFDWQGPEHAFEKVKEEMLEFEETLKSGDRVAQMEEMGDLLMIIANVGRLLKLDAEMSLNEANEKFMRRFQFIENAMSVENRELCALEIDRMEHFWKEAKKWEKS